MKNKIVLTIKGDSFDVANIISRVSGGMLTLTIGVYEDLINAISHFFKDKKSSFKFLLIFGLGAGLLILLMSKVIRLYLEKFPFPTTLFFIGLIVGSSSLLTRRVRKNKLKLWNLLLFLITFGVVSGMVFLQEGSNVVSLSIFIPWTTFVLFAVDMITKSNESLFIKYGLSTYYAILGFLVASIFTIYFTLFQVSFSNIAVFTGILLFVISTMIGYKLGDV